MRPLQRELIFQTDTKFQFSFQTFSLCFSASHQRRCPYLPLQIQFACLTNCPMLITSWTLLLLYYSRPKLKKENMSKAFYLSFKFFAQQERAQPNIGIHEHRQQRESVFVPETFAVEVCGKDWICVDHQTSHTRLTSRRLNTHLFV